MLTRIVRLFNCDSENEIHTDTDGSLKVDFSLNVAIFWDRAPCSPHVNRRFEGTNHLHVQGLNSMKQEIKCAAGACGPPNHRFAYGVHGALSHKIATFVSIPMRTSNPSFLLLLLKSGTANLDFFPN
jgi:hypothetical protein